MNPENSRIVLVGNEKGGTGKTTLAITLATVHATAGGNPIILDTDPGQQSAVAWHSARLANYPNAPDITVSRFADADRLPQAARDLRATYDLVLIDTGAMDSAYLRAALTCAHTMVLPTATDALELWVLRRMEALLATARAHNPAMRLVIAAARTPSRRAAVAKEELRAWMHAYTPAMPQAEITVLGQRSAISRAIGQGLGVNELRHRPDRLAVREAQALYDQVMTA